MINVNPSFAEVLFAVDVPVWGLVVLLTAAVLLATGAIKLLDYLRRKDAEGESLAKPI